jgi:uncharacterized protein YndB with AHSA1/START domain
VTPARPGGFMKTTDDPVVVEQSYNATAKTVWNAITQVDLMCQWYFDNIPAFEAKVGFEIRFDVRHEGRVFPHLWKVTEVVPEKKLVYDWKFDGYAGDSYVVWELSEENDTTMLRITCHVREDFSDDIPEFRRESCVAGWEYFLQQSLKEFLETNLSS